jgi:phosphomannomutase
MISVAGIRGIVGESLTAPVVSRYAAAFAETMGTGPIVVGRDARPSGPWMYHAVAAGLLGMGREVVNVGLATTPTTQLAVEAMHAAGGIIITASHNPSPWNALKLLSPEGEFLGPEAGQRVQERYRSDAPAWRDAAELGHERDESGALERHLERVLGLSGIDLAAIRARKLNIVVDGCASVGGVAVPALIDRLGGTTIPLDCEPNGRFTRELEPLPEHLGALGERVRASGADFGVAVDPDADRAAFVDERGKPLGEEYTVALGTLAVLSKTPGPVVTNLSTSRMLDAVCERFGVPLHRSPVGEAHVVAEMKRRKAVAGGEGNGGMILPAAHYGRDSLVAVILVAQLLAERGGTLRALADELPRYSMLKEKLEKPDTPWERSAARLQETFTDYAVETVDGLRFSHGDEWVHVRASGTEPVVRVIAESPAEPRTRNLIERARQALRAAA